MGIVSDELKRVAKPRRSTPKNTQAHRLLTRPVQAKREGAGAVTNAVRAVRGAASLEHVEMASTQGREVPVDEGF
jgi:hypothetical protein